MNQNTKAFIVEASRKYGARSILNREQITRLTEEAGLPWPYWLVTKAEYRAGRGLYRLPALASAMPAPSSTEPAPSSTVQFTSAMPAPSSTEPAPMVRQKRLLDESDSAVPAPFPGFVPFGFFTELRKIIGANIFYPIFISGLSGNGKTLMVEQACASLKRECIRINITIETDESDLLGGPTLIDGNVVFRDGPVIQAMKRGAVLLIDEVDRGSNKLMAIQGILEGKPYYNKKTGEMVYPKQGFNVIATANSKGRGSEDGRYLSQILDDAFLERFPITVEQNYPESRIETKILSSVLVNEPDFIAHLVKWAEVIRKTFEDGGIDEIISTRRLVHIAQAYNIFQDRKTAIKYCINRFDEETKNAFLDLYTKVDITANPPVPESENPKSEVQNPPTPATSDAAGDIPF